jgi:hypothetical protein
MTQETGTTRRILLVRRFELLWNRSGMQGREDIACL